MWKLIKTSTDNHNWTPGKRGAGYIHARTNTPDSFDLLNYSIRTWNISSDETDDIEKEIRRRRPIDLIVFKFYITPSGGVHAGPEGFQNRTSRTDRAVIDFLNRKDNHLHDGRNNVDKSAAYDLRAFVSSFKTRLSHSLTWVKGGKGRGLMFNDGKLVTWPVDKKGNPQHADMYEYLTNTKLPESHSVQDFTEGTPFDIYEDGTLAFFSDYIPEELLTDLSKIDYRLKTSKKAKEKFTKEDAIELLEKNDWDYDANEFWVGMNDELEHDWLTHGDPDTTAKIVADHLKEHPDYYSKLHNLFKEADAPKGEYYHAAPASERETIQELGLVSGRPRASGNWPGYEGLPHPLENQPMGVYVSRNPEGAAAFNKNFAKDHPLNQPMDVWKVPAEQIKEIWQDPMGAANAEFFVPHDISGVELYAPAEGQQKSAALYPGFNTHFHPYTGRQCNCSYGQNQNGPAIGRTASQAVRKVKNQDQKHLRNDRGQQVLDFLHKMISGHGIGEKGEFGQGDYPGIEGMVPWIVKQMKTGWIAPFINDEGNVSNLGQFDSFRNSTPEQAKLVISRRNQFPIDVEGVSDITPLQENYGSEGYKFVSGETDSPQVRAIFINNYGDSPLGLAEMQSIIESRPDAKIYVQGDDEATSSLRQLYPDRENLDIGSGSAQYAMRFAKNEVDSVPEDQVAVDYSIELPFNFYRSIPWEDWSDWFNATNAPAREGKDIMKMNPTEVSNAAREHHEYLVELENEKRLKEQFAETKDEDVVYRIQDPKYRGWTVKQIKNREDAELESEVLGHCIGSDEQNYAHNIEEGRIRAFSLRDEHGIPKLTWHYNPDETLAHIQGKSSDSYDMFRSLVTEFNEASGNDDDEGGSGREEQLEGEQEEAYEINLPDVDNVEDYVYQNHPDGDGRWELAHQIAEQDGLVVGENTEVHTGDVAWGEIAYDLFENYEPGSEYTNDFFYTLVEGGWGMNEFAEAADDYINEWKEENKTTLAEQHPQLEDFEGPYDRPHRPATPEEMQEIEPDMFAYYEEWKARHTNPQTGRLQEPQHIPVRDREQYEERYRGDNLWSIAPMWEERRDIMGDLIKVNEQGWGPTAYLPASQNPAYREKATEPTGRPCEACEGTGSVENPWGGRRECTECKGTGAGVVPITIGPNEQRVLQEPSGQMYFGKLTVKEKAVAWDMPAHKLSKAQAKYVNGEI